MCRGGKGIDHGTRKRTMRKDREIFRDGGTGGDIEGNRIYKH